MPATYYHGGIKGLKTGDLLVPSPPVVTDGCPICVARSEGRSCSAGEYRQWVMRFGAEAKPILKELEGVPDDARIDPPTQNDAVYMTTVYEYARWYAARSAGDLYQVKPVGEIGESVEDSFPTFMAKKAIVVKVVERKVRLDRRDRRKLNKMWEKADKRRNYGNTKG